jgi:hypothetical protein
MKIDILHKVLNGLYKYLPTIKCEKVLPKTGFKLKYHNKFN